MKILGKIMFGLAALVSGCVTIDSSIISQYDNQKVIATYTDRESMVVKSEDESAKYAMQRKEEGANCTLNIPNEVLFDAGCNETVDQFTMGNVTIFRDGTVLPDASSYSGDKKAIEDLFAQQDSKLFSYKKGLRVEEALDNWNGGWGFFKRYNTWQRNKIRR